MQLRDGRNAATVAGFTVAAIQGDAGVAAVAITAGVGRLDMVVRVLAMARCTDDTLRLGP